MTSLMMLDVAGPSFNYVMTSIHTHIQSLFFTKGLHCKSHNTVIQLNKTNLILQSVSTLT